jgi:acyl-CoA reductase-like NAD-dependent aldehyde dehydrogenase
MEWRFAVKHDTVYVDGAWVTPADGDWCELEDPATESLFASALLAGESTVGAAVAAARQAFDEGTWTSLTREERLDADKVVPSPSP